MPATMPATPPAAQVQAVAVVSEDWAADAARPVPPVAAKPAPKAAVPVELGDARIRQAVSETLAAAADKTEVPANRQDALLAPVFSGDKQNEEFARQFAYAKTPYCLGHGGLKFQPPKIGPIVFGGFLAIPFVVVAKLRGKCK